jgi:hypothetical protein
MLIELGDTMRGLHRTRRTRRSAVAIASSFAVLVVLSIIARPIQTSRDPELAARVDPGDMPAARITIVHTDRTVLSRYAAAPPSRVRLLDDEALLDDLAAIGRPAGLIRSGGRAWLTANVTSALPAAEPNANEPPL